MAGFWNSRIQVPVWKPELDHKGDLTTAPPEKDGQVVFIELFDENKNRGCANAAEDKLYSFSLPNTSGSGGLAVNIRGNVQFANGYCYFSGFFINKKVFGIHQGWTETYFGALDTFEVVKSGQHCLARQ